MRAVPWLCAALAACGGSPVDPVAEEAIWQDAGRLAVERDLALPEVKDGEFAHPLMRVVVKKDRVDVDNRAWILFRTGGSAPADPDAVVVREGVVTLQEGRWPDGDAGRLAGDRLEAALRDATRGSASPGVHLLADRDVPAGTVMTAAYRAAAYGGYPVPTGRVGAEVRGLFAGRAPPYSLAPCAGEVTIYLGDDRATVADRSGGPLDVPPIPRMEAGFAERSLGNALDSVAAACAVHWDGAAGRALADVPPAERLPDAAWRCVGVKVAVPFDATFPYRDLATILADLWTRYPAVHASGLVVGVPAATPPADLADPKTRWDVCGDDLEDRLLSWQSQHENGGPIREGERVMKRYAPPEPPSAAATEQLLRDSALLQALFGAGDTPAPRPSPVSEIGFDPKLAVGAGTAGEPSAASQRAATREALDLALKEHAGKPPDPARTEAEAGKKPIPAPVIP